MNVSLYNKISDYSFNFYYYFLHFFFLCFKLIFNFFQKTIYSRLNKQTNRNFLSNYFQKGKNKVKFGCYYQCKSNNKIIESLSWIFNYKSKARKNE